MRSRPPRSPSLAHLHAYQLKRSVSLCAQIDEAACWVIRHLRHHHERWRASSGVGRGLSHQNLRGLVPDGALASNALWELVVDRVSRDPCVRCVKTSDGGDMWQWVAPAGGALAA